MDREYDFSGYVTRNNILCTDGRTIRQDAFKHNDGKEVPIVWNHQYANVSNVLGLMTLENREDGVYGYGRFAHTADGGKAKSLVEEGVIKAMSIHATQVKETEDGDVLHGDIKEVSLVLAGANRGAYIDTVFSHGDYLDDERYICFPDDSNIILHAEEKNNKEETTSTDNKEETKTDSEPKEKTVQDVIDSMTEEQRNVMNYFVGLAAEGETDVEQSENMEEDSKMKKNAFDVDHKETETNKTLTHSEQMVILKDGKRIGSLKESVLKHAQTYGIEQIDYLFPDYKTTSTTPEWIKRDTGWVSKVMSGVKHIPFSRIKSVFADITADEARAKGYTKGNIKLEEIFTLLKRTTDPTTVYKKQKMDRDDIVDITDFSVVAWLKTEMRMMLDEELARAFLIGDGRPSYSNDKIKEDNIRPIATDQDLFTIKAKVQVSSGAKVEDKAKEFIKTVIRSRKQYKGSGSPTLYTTEDWITECLLLTDEMGRDLYDSIEKLAIKMRVKEIVAVEPMETAKTSDSKPLMGILVNLNDYSVGADKGGSINMFEDFDIDYNQEKYLIETRCSAALTKPYSAVAFGLYEE